MRENRWQKWRWYNKIEMAINVIFLVIEMAIKKSHADLLSGRSIGKKKYNAGEKGII